MHEFKCHKEFKMKFITLCKEECECNGEAVSCYDHETGKVIIRYVCKEDRCVKNDKK